MTKLLDKFKELSGMQNQNDAMRQALQHAQAMQQNLAIRIPLTDNEKKEVEALLSERKRKIFEQQLKYFASLPEDIREAILSIEKEKTIKLAIDTMNKITSYPTGREADLLQKANGDSYRSYHHELSGKNTFLSYKEMMDIHLDECARDILLNDKQKEDK